MKNNVNPYLDLLPIMAKDINTQTRSNAKMQKIIKKFKDKTITYEDAFVYAQEKGKIISNVFKKKISSDIFHDGQLHKKTAEEILLPILKTNYQDIDVLTEMAQKNMNKQLGTSLAVQKSKKAANRAKGIIKYITEDTVDARKKSFLEKVETYSKKHVDEAIEENARLLAESGFKTTITRTAHAGACQYCKDLAGVYNYDDVSDTGNDVFRRHDNCNCLVAYKSARTYQNVHTKKSLSKDKIREIEKEVLNS